MWEALSILNDTETLEAFKILDDATCHGFEFKVENHRIYYRELV